MLTAGVRSRDSQQQQTSGLLSFPVQISRYEVGLKIFSVKKKKKKTLDGYFPLLSWDTLFKFQLLNKRRPSRWLQDLKHLFVLKLINLIPQILKSTHFANLERPF